MLTCFLIAEYQNIQNLFLPTSLWTNYIIPKFTEAKQEKVWDSATPKWSFNNDNDSGLEVSDQYEDDPLH